MLFTVFLSLKQKSQIHRINQVKPAPAYYIDSLSIIKMSEEVEESKVLSSQEVLELFVKHSKLHEKDQFDEKEWKQFLRENIDYIQFAQYSRLTNTKRIAEYVNLHLRDSSTPE